MATYPVPQKLKKTWADTRKQLVSTFQAMGATPTLVDAVIGETPEDAYQRTIMGLATGGGATRIDSPTPYMRNMIDALNPGAQQRPINQAIEAAIPLMRDPVARQKIMELMMQIGR